MKIKDLQHGVGLKRPLLYLLSYTPGSLQRTIISPCADSVNKTLHDSVRDGRKGGPQESATCPKSADVRSKCAGSTLHFASAKAQRPHIPSSHCEPITARSLKLIAPSSYRSARESMGTYASPPSFTMFRISLSERA